MISERSAKKYCSEDISLIENYQQAIADKEKKWEIHHRRECDSEGRTLFTHKQLKKMNLYYKRPPKELIFVTRSMHWKLHREMREKCAKTWGKKGGKSLSKIEKKSIPILQFAKDRKFVKEWPSAIEVQRQLGISQSNLCQCCKGKLKSTGGFIWRYKNKKA